jgi:hypothetical protein
MWCVSAPGARQGTDRRFCIGLSRFTDGRSDARRHTPRAFPDLVAFCARNHIRGETRESCCRVPTAEPAALCSSCSRSWSSSPTSSDPPLRTPDTKYTYNLATRGFQATTTKFGFESDPPLVRSSRGLFSTRRSTGKPANIPKGGPYGPPFGVVRGRLASANGIQHPRTRIPRCGPAARGPGAPAR